MDDVGGKARFRSVLSNYPTGVCLVTAIHDGEPVGLIVGTFNSVSLEPALVAFFPQKTSGSWARIRAAGSFCVNILSAEQKDLCDRFASPGGRRFEGLDLDLDRNGAPIVPDAVAWLHCTLHAVHEAGDHHIAVGMVQEMESRVDGADPLLFLRGGFGGFFCGPLDGSGPTAPRC